MATRKTGSFVIERKTRLLCIQKNLKNQTTHIHDSWCQGFRSPFLDVHVSDKEVKGEP